MLLAPIALVLAVGAGWWWWQDAAGDTEFRGARDDRPLIARAEETLRGEPGVVAVTYEPAGQRWSVTVDPRVLDPAGEAGYFCALLKGAGVVVATTNVRVIDRAALFAPGATAERAVKDVARCGTSPLP